MAGKYDVAAYIWPSYTGDEPRARIFQIPGTQLAPEAFVGICQRSGPLCDGRADRGCGGPRRQCVYL